MSVDQFRFVFTLLFLSFSRESLSLFSISNMYVLFTLLNFSYYSKENLSLFSISNVYVFCVIPASFMSYLSCVVSNVQPPAL